MSLIDVQDLTKTFKVRQRSAGTGTGAALRRLLRPGWELREAVSHVSFTIGEGEIVGYLGPNGAGKSTTIKCLCGILVPTSGSVRVAGLDPFRERVALSRQLGAMFGQKTTLWWDVAVIETYQLLRQIYEVPRPRYEETLALLTKTLGLGEFLHLPVRQLSLGQRVRADLGAAFLHRPRLLLLDEPTIGLDVAVKASLRQFVKQMRDLTGVTVLLTTHDLRDIELLCDRLIIIDHGRLCSRARSRRPSPATRRRAPSWSSWPPRSAGRCRCRAPARWLATTPTATLTASSCAFASAATSCPSPRSLPT